MASTFERAVNILRVESCHGPLDLLTDQIDSVRDLLSLRATCRAFSTLRQINIHIFKTIYMHAPSHGEQCVDALTSLGSLCRTLVVKIAFPCVPKPDIYHVADHGSASGSRGSKPNLAGRTHRRHIEEDHKYERPHLLERRRLAKIAALPEPIAWKFVLQRRPHQSNPTHLKAWHKTLSFFPNITTLNIACNGDPRWPGCTDIEICLINLRICIERVNFKYLRQVVLDPIHAAGIMHFRWAGLGAYGEANGCAPPSPTQSTPTGTPWQRLDSLNLRIRNPLIDGRTNERQRTIFMKVFVDYLRSFKRTLRVLKLQWMEGDGPDPSLLMKDTACEQRAGDTLWLRLEELWLGNMLVDRASAVAINSYAPVLQKLMIVTSQRGGRVHGNDQSEWGPVGANDILWTDMLHSVHNGQTSPGRSEASSSWTSRIVPIGLDI